MNTIIRFTVCKPNIIGYLCALSVVCWFHAAPAWAGNLDDHMKEASGEIIKVAQKRGWKSIGVLKFQVQIGDAKPCWDVGRLNSLMATRLENALILQNVMRELDPPIEVTRNAGEAAASMFKELDYFNKDARKKLLTMKFPMAWGNKKCQVDAFVTGTVVVSENMSKTKVVFQAWDKEDNKMKQIASFDAVTDRTTLVEMNKNFIIERSADLDSSSSFEAYAAQSVKKKNKESLEDLLSFKVFYGNPKKGGKIEWNEIEIEKSEGQTRIKSPKEGQKVRFELMAKKERLGVVLLVNGVNTFRKEEGLLPKQYSYWILDKPGVVYNVNGFYPEADAKPEEFKILPEEQAQYYPLQDNSKRGLIELFVFREDLKQDQAVEDTNLKKVNTPATSFEEAANQLLGSMKIKKKSLIVPGTEIFDRPVQIVPYDDPGWIAGEVISYRNP